VTPARGRGRLLRVGTEAAAWSVEGRTGGRLALARDLSSHFVGPVRDSAGAALTLMTVTDRRYLDAARWGDVNTVELTGWASRASAIARGVKRARIAFTVGQSFTPLPIATSPFVPAGAHALRGATYARGALTFRRERRLGRVSLSSRAALAGTLGGTAVPVQRRIFLAGADPYQTFGNPLLRSRGALLAGEGVHYQSPGGGDLRGLSPALTASWLVGVGTDIGLAVVERAQGGLFREIRLAAFADAALLDPRALGRDAVADAGLGLRAEHRIGPTTFVTRLDLPLLVTRPAAVVGAGAADGVFKLRLVWSLEDAL
jgi:hypothetical protein